MKRAVGHGPRQPTVSDDHRTIVEPGGNKLSLLYLASDGSRMVTGQVLPIDSGVTIS
jgi:hypothetical protein